MGDQERDIFVALMIIALLLVLIVSYFFYQLYRQQQLLNKFKKEKNKSEIISSESERNDIAVELHNDILPYLASVKMRLSGVGDEQNQVLNECIPVIDLCIDRMRAISKKTAPISEYEFSFMTALERYVKKTGLGNGLEFEFLELDHVDLSMDQNNQIYRVLQEIIQNAVKHSGASKFMIESTREDNNLLIRTADNGIGFDNHKVRSKHAYGLGLLIIQSRIDYLNGIIVKDEVLTGGTRYNIRIPL